LGENIANQTASGHADGVAYYTRARDAVRAAIAAHQPYGHTEEQSQPLPKPANPVTGKWFVFTDVGCASSCLDFMDARRRLGVLQLGSPPYADPLYRANPAPLSPSVLVWFSDALKIHRPRVRGNNQGYTPQIPWPGGPVTDESIAKWVVTL